MKTFKKEASSLPYIKGSFFRLRTRWWGSITRFIGLRITYTKLKEIQYTHTEHLVQSRDTIVQNN